MEETIKKVEKKAEEFAQKLEDQANKIEEECFGKFDHDGILSFSMKF